MIDPGATHSFIYVKLIAIVNIEIQPIDCSMVISLPTRDSLIADRVYMGCRVIIEGHEFRANLVLLEIQDFDVILGMDCCLDIMPPWIALGKKLSSVDRGNQRLLFVG